jgi:acyl carrier protein
MDPVKEKVREFLSRYIPTRGLADGDDIFATGVVNSMLAMQLVMYVEKEFGVAIEPDDLELEYFESINAIADLVRRKTASQATA